MGQLWTGSPLWRKNKTVNSIHQNASENIVCEIAANVSRGGRVNEFMYRKIQPRLLPMHFLKPENVQNKTAIISIKNGVIDIARVIWWHTNVQHHRVQFITTPGMYILP